MSVSIDLKVNVTNASITDKMKASLEKVGQALSSREVAFDLFNSNLLFLKGFGFLFLIFMAIVNYEIHGKKTGPISRTPYKFFLESCVFAICGVIPFLLLVYLRNGVINTQEVIKWSLMLFVAFFVLNYLLELCGLYAILFDYNENETPAPTGADDSEPYVADFKQSFSYTATFFMITLFVYCLLVMLMSVFMVHDTSPGYKKFTTLPSFLVFFVEMILFGAISAVPIYLMAWDRDRLSTHTSFEFLIVTAKFALLHIILQLSGFYTYLFSNEKPK